MEKKVHDENVVTVVEKLSAGTELVAPKDALAKKIASGKKLTVKLGADPTAPDLHLGHAVVLSKLRQFQDLGHNIVFLIGDFTARIGDPTGKSKTRPPLSEEQIAHNTKTYLEQVGKILDLDKVSLRFNSEWLDKLTSRQWVELCGKVTLARLIERDDFSKRLAEKRAIGFHELLYPLMQGYDSVELNADVELGGTDQTFNLMMGRFLQEHYGQEPQVVLTVPILEGLDGVQKMSKSLGNYIGLTEDPAQAYGKLMSISDELMWRYYSLLLHKTEKEIQSMKQAIADSKQHPMDLKKAMAFGVVARFWSEPEAKKAQQSFEALFQKKDLNKAQEVELSDISGETWIVDILKKLGAVTTTSEARRLIQNGAVSIDGEKVTDFKAQISLISGMVIKVGKHRFYKVIVEG